ncbi:MAG TPA: hypothetical protein VK610_08990 [Rhodothermales bacterium]|nr:hypothetical protein [Rhodothermales bacterium]
MLVWLPVFLFLVVVPACGVAWYVAVLRRMEREEVPEPPRGALFLVFAAYGLVLLFVLTLVPPMGYSGMHLLGAVALVFVGGPGMGVLALRLYPRRGLSRYHAAAYTLSAAFAGGVFVLVMAAGLL